MIKTISSFIFLLLSCDAITQNVGIGTNSPQAKLDVKGGMRTGGTNNFLLYDSLSGKFSWNNSYIWATGAQYLMKHSASAEGLYYNSSQISYLNAVGVPVFFTNWTTGNGYFANHLGIGTINPLARLHVADSSVVFSATGLVSPAANPPISGAGIRMMWYADKGAFRTGLVQGNEWDNDNIGEYSFAAGINTKAIGLVTMALGYQTTALAHYSTALGFQTTARGEYSTAIGSNTLASGNISTAMGFGTTASGLLSTATGYSTKAKSDYSFTIGKFNDTTVNNSLFEIGKGTADNARSNAVTVLSNGNTGIGTKFPLARLHVVDSSVVFSAPGDLVFPPGDPPVSGAGRRMMWYVDNAAFRAGYVDATQWNKASVGRYSFAAGYNPVAGGTGSVAIGFLPTASGSTAIALGNSTNAIGESSFATGGFTTASGIYATAFGHGTIASENSSTATGYITTASGTASTAMGYNTAASGSASVAMGWYSIASNSVSTAMGFGTTASGFSSVATGENTTAIGDLSTAAGNATTARGYSSIAMGVGTKAKSYGSMSLGVNNDSTDNPNPGLATASDRIFQIGNGDNIANTRSNAMTVLRNGNTGIGRTDPDFPLSFSDNLGTKISLYGTSSYHYGIGIQGFRLQIFTPDASGNVIFGYGSSSVLTETMRIQGNGNVGIGTSSPSQKLSVAGGVCATGSFSSCSDIRYKKDFTPINNPLSSVLSLNGFYYHWKQDEFPDMQFSDKRQLGFSAQEVEKLFPEIVMTDANGYKSVDYGRMTPVLVEAIKEQQKNISSQQQRIDQLEKDIAELKTLVRKLSNK